MATLSQHRHGICAQRALCTTKIPLLFSRNSHHFLMHQHSTPAGLHGTPPAFAEQPPAPAPQHCSGEAALCVHIAQFGNSPNQPPISIRRIGPSRRTLEVSTHRLFCGLHIATYRSSTRLLCCLQACGCSSLARGTSASKLPTGPSAFSFLVCLLACLPPAGPRSSGCLPQVQGSPSGGM